MLKTRKMPTVALCFRDAQKLKLHTDSCNYFILWLYLKNKVLCQCDWSKVDRHRIFAAYLTSARWRLALNLNGNIGQALHRQVVLGRTGNRSSPLQEAKCSFPHLPDTRLRKVSSFCAVAGSSPLESVCKGALSGFFGVAEWCNGWLGNWNIGEFEVVK